MAADGAGLSAEPIDAGIVDVLAGKILVAWLRNRYQLLFPLAFDLARLDRAQARLMVQAMAVAAEADGVLDPAERDRLATVVQRLGQADADRAELDRAIEAPGSLNDLLAEVRDTRTAGLVYVAALLALDQRRPVNEYWLRYLAARLQLSDELVASLQQRFRSSG